MNTSSSAARTTREARRAPEVSRAPLTAEVGGARPTRAVLPEAERDGLADAFARRVADVSIVACMVQIGTRVPGDVWRTGHDESDCLFLVSRNNVLRRRVNACL